MICQFIDEHRDRFGVVVICRALAVHGVQIAPRTYWAHRSSAPSKRALWDTTITEILPGIYERARFLTPGLRCCRPPRNGVRPLRTDYSTTLVRSAIRGLLNDWGGRRRSGPAHRPP